MKRSQLRNIIKGTLVELLLEAKIAKATSVSTERAEEIAKKLKVDASVNIEELRRGMEVEQEHAKTLGTDDLKKIAQVALDHLKEIPDYYTRLDKMEKEAKKTNEAGGAVSKPRHDPDTHPISHAYDQGKWNVKKGVSKDREYKHPGKYAKDPSTRSAYQQGYDSKKEEETNEVSTTAGAPGFMTPKAFEKKKKKRKTQKNGWS